MKRKKIYFGLNLLIAVSIYLFPVKQINAQSTEAKNYYIKAYDLQKADKTSEAIEYYKKAIELYPDYADAHYQLGRAYYTIAGRKNKVMKNRKGSSTKQKYVPVWKGKKDELYLALEEFKKVSAIQPGATDAISLCGIIYHNLGEFSKAIEYHKKSIDIDGRGLDAQDSRHDMALIYLVSFKNETKAIELLEENLKINPSHELSKQLLNAINTATETEIVFVDNLDIGISYYNKAKEQIEIALLVPANENEKFNIEIEKADEMLKKALHYMERCFDIRPHDKDVQEYLKNIYYRLKMMDKYNEMLEMLEK